MKARRVKGIEPDSSFREGFARIIAVRLGEMVSLAEPAVDSADAGPLHDLRIAAKRLRYVLELSEPCLGEVANRSAKRARALQDVLGEIHDCDVLGPMIREHEAALRTADAEALAASRDAALDPGAVATAPGARLHRGVAVLAVHVEARRAALYSEFLAEWRRFEESGIESELRQVTGR